MRLKILIVEASEHLRTMLGVMVRPIKGEIYLADNAEAGLALAKLVKPELIIANYGQDGSGESFCRSVRADEILAKTPIVLLSAYASHLSMGRYRQTGCDQVVYMPFKCLDLFVAIRAALARDDRDPRVIPVMYRNGECDLLDPGRLEQLIRAGEIDCFRRRDGMVFIDRDPIRVDQRENYHGADRRCCAT